MDLLASARSRHHITDCGGMEAQGLRVGPLSRDTTRVPRAPPQPSQPKSDLSDFGQSSSDRARLNPSSVASGEREHTESAAPLYTNRTLMVSHRAVAAARETKPPAAGLVQSQRRSVRLTRRPSSRSTVVVTVRQRARGPISTPRGPTPTVTPE